MPSLGGFATISLFQLLCEKHCHSCYLLDNVFHNLGYLTVLFVPLICELNNLGGGTFSLNSPLLENSFYSSSLHVILKQ